MQPPLPTDTSPTGLTTTEFERQPMGLTCTPCTFRRRQRVRHQQQLAVNAKQANCQHLSLDYVQQQPSRTTSISTQTQHEANTPFPANTQHPGNADHRDNDRPHSPSTVLEIDYVDLPALVAEPGLTTTDEESEESIPELLPMPPVEDDATHRAHMQRVDDNAASASEAATSAGTPVGTDLIPARPAPPRLLDPTSVQHYTGDILTSEATYIVHQTNCVTRNAAG